jgi:rubrerythrin
MKKVEFDEILEMAISQEFAANRFYVDLATRVTDPSTKEALEYLAAEEIRHREFLEGYLRGEAPDGGLGLKEVIDGQVVEFLGAPAWDDACKPEEAFLIAAKKEKASNEFYSRLAQFHPEGPVKDLLLQLAQEELAHKEKVEYLYANTAFPQTDGG